MRRAEPGAGEQSPASGSQNQGRRAPKRREQIPGQLPPLKTRGTRHPEPKAQDLDSDPKRRGSGPEAGAQMAETGAHSKEPGFQSRVT